MIGNQMKFFSHSIFNYILNVKSFISTLFHRFLCDKLCANELSHANGGNCTIEWKKISCSALALKLNIKRCDLLDELKANNVEWTFEIIEIFVKEIDISIFIFHIFSSPGT